MDSNESQENSRILALDSLIKQENFEKLTEMLVEMPTAQAVEFLGEQESLDDIITYLDLLNYENAGRIVAEFELELQMELFRKLGNAFWSPSTN